MKAVLIEEFERTPIIASVPEPTAPADGVVIRVEATGMCRSDWHGWMGHDPDVRLPHVPGHEFSGVIDEVGAAVTRWKPGERVTVPFAVGCGSCPECLAGNQHICDDYFQPGFTAWGSFAELVAVRYADTNLVRLPEDIEFVEAASLGCRFITSYRAVVARGRVAPGEWVAVHGCGGVGLSAVMISDALGAKVVAVDIQAEALSLARSIGAAHVVNSREEPNIIERIKDVTAGGAHVSIDALGSIETCRNSILCLRKRGRHVQVGLMVADYKDALVPMNLVIANELEILGSHGMQAHQYAPMMEMILVGKLEPARLVNRRITLEEAPAILESMGRFKETGVTVIDRI